MHASTLSLYFRSRDMLLDIRHRILNVRAGGDREVFVQQIGVPQFAGSGSIKTMMLTAAHALGVEDPEKYIDNDGKLRVRGWNEHWIKPCIVTINGNYVFINWIDGKQMSFRMHNRITAANMLAALWMIMHNMGREHTRFDTKPSPRTPRERRNKTLWVTGRRKQ